MINFNAPHVLVGIVDNALLLMSDEDREHLLENYCNWMIVNKILTRHTNEGGSTSAMRYCEYLSIDPDGHYWRDKFKKEED